jgi:uncharacterized lipoprotein YbaY
MPWIPLSHRIDPGPDRCGLSAALRSAPHRIASLIWFAMPFLLAACSGGNDSADRASGEVTGTHVAGDQIALPADATVQLKLVEIDPDAQQPKVVAEQFLTHPGTFPIEFKIPYVPAVIDDDRDYGVEISIMSGKQLLFTSSAAAPVITHGHPEEVEIAVETLAAEAGTGHGATTGGG